MADPHDRTTHLAAQDLAEAVGRAVGAAPVWDLHTHLYPPQFGTPMGRGIAADPAGLMLWGVDELVTYHYLIAEVLREAPDLSPEAFYARSKPEQADLIWQKLFVEATPLSEACRGVVTTLSKLGLDPNEPTLAGHRRWFAEQTPQGQIDRVLELAGVDTVTMTNDVFDENELQRWLAPGGVDRDPRFPAVLRFDPLVVDWPSAARRLSDWGYAADAQASAGSIDAVRRFLAEWIGRLNPVYCAMSLPPEWRYPAEGPGNRVLAEAIVPACEEHGLPLALMIGVTRGVNPALRQAGDGVGVADIDSLSALCRDFPGQRFLATLLARENQHALAVAARKFSNLTPFGCWWFINNPSLIEETTRMRVELLGPTFIPQHSDARVLEQLIYKWDHSRKLLAKVLSDKYADLAAAGWRIAPAAIERDVHRLLRGNVAALLDPS